MKINQNLNAQEIFAKLDSLDKNGSDGKIEASIWNQFAQIAGGKEIKNMICEENAIKSISTYLARASEDVKEKISNFLNLNNTGAEETSNNQPSYFSKSLDELKKDRSELEKVVFAEASNGMRYADAKEKLSKLWHNVAESRFGGWEMIVVDLNTKMLERLKWAIEKYHPELLSEFNMAKEAVQEMEEKNPKISRQYKNYKLIDSSIKFGEKIDKEQLKRAFS